MQEARTTRFWHPASFVTRSVSLRLRLMVTSTLDLVNGFAVPGKGSTGEAAELVRGLDGFHGNQEGAQITDLCQQPMQGSLVSDRTTEACGTVLFAGQSEVTEPG